MKRRLLLCAFAIAVSVVTLVLLLALERTPVVAIAGGGTLERGTPTPASVAAMFPVEIPASAGREEAPLASLPPTPASPPEARLRAAVSELAETLQAHVDRPAWETQLDALALALGPAVESEAAELAADPARALHERVAAVEILRKLDESRSTPALALPGSALSALREATASSGNPALASAAARSLAAFGGPADLRRLANTLASPSDPAARRVALWGLCASRGAGAELEVARILGSAPDESTVDLALSVLVARGAPAGEDVQVPELAGVCAAIAADPERTLSIRKRAVLALGARKDDAASSTLLALARDAETPHELARSAMHALAAGAGADALEELELLATNAELPLERRCAAAEALLCSGVEPPEGCAITEPLVEAAEHAEHPAERCRAIAALTSSTALEPILARIAENDADPRVRSTARRKIAERMRGER